jgi:hemolysin III
MSTSSAERARSRVSSSVNEALIPRLRGRLHVYAFWAALIGAPILVARAPAGDARVACVIYGSALCSLFAVSALFHRWRWSPRWRPLLRRLDHGTIFVFIAASATPLAVLILTDEMRTAVLAIVWSGAVVGVLASVAWIDAPRALVAASYVAVGCAALAGLPQIVDRLPLTGLLLFAAGGALYITGAVIYAKRRPNPWPDSFGFHELFHAFVVVAAATHFAAIVAFVLPAAAG